MAESKVRKVILAVPDQVQLLDLSGPAHVFYEARALGAPLSLHFMSLNGKNEVKSIAGLAFSQLETYTDFTLRKDDLIIIPGLDYEIFKKKRLGKDYGAFYKWLTLQYEQGATVCSVCTGSFILAASGLANGKQLTSHWKYIHEMQELFPKVLVVTNKLFTEDERLYSSAGVSSGIDLSLYLIEQGYGSKMASDVAREMVVYFRRGAGDPQLSVFLQFRNHIESRVHDAQNFMAANLSKSLKLSKISDHISMSERQLSRLFKKTLGITVGDYITRLRVEKAISLLQHGNKVSVVAEECGMKSTNQLRNLLKSQAGLLPSDLLNNK